MLQNIIVFLIVAAAAVYLARSAWSSLAGKKSCGSCGTGGGCSKTTAKVQPPPNALIQISLNGKSGPSQDAAKFPGHSPDH